MGAQQGVWGQKPLSTPDNLTQAGRLQALVAAPPPLRFTSPALVLFFRKNY